MKEIESVGAFYCLFSSRIWGFLFLREKKKYEEENARRFLLLVS